MVQMILQEAPERPHLQPFYETSMAAALKAMLLAGQGMGWFPGSLVLEEIKKRQLVRAGGPAWDAELEIRIYRSRETKKPAVTKLWDSLCSL
jgi:DNA-binding transcriptional LysR family regulator